MRKVFYTFYVVRQFWRIQTKPLFNLLSFAFTSFVNFTNHVDIAKYDLLMENILLLSSLQHDIEAKADNIALHLTSEYPTLKSIPSEDEESLKGTISIAIKIPSFAKESRKDCFEVSNFENEIKLLYCDYNKDETVEKLPLHSVF